MQARVHDQCDRTFQLAYECAPFRFVVAVQTEFIAERGCIQGPALHEGGLAAEPPELGQVDPLLLKRGLIMASRYCFLKKSRDLNLSGPNRIGFDMHVEDPWRRRAVRRGRLAGLGLR